MIITPVTESEDTVTLSRADYEALLTAVEDMVDLAAVETHRAHEARVGWQTARETYLTWDEAERILAGESPLKVWRERRGLTQRALAAKAAVSPSYLADIERGAKPGSTTALARLAHALAVSVEALLPPAN